MEENKSNGYRQHSYDRPTKRYCQMLDLYDDPELIARYRAAHEHSWPEIPAGIKAVGILEMEIYITGNHLFMIVETPLDFEWNEAFARLAKMDRQDEWETFVGQFQRSTPGSSSSEKWTLMERMFKLP